MDMKKYAAELIGTFWLTFAGCGSAVIAATFPQVGIGLVGVSLTFGLSVVTMPYVIAQVAGAIIAAALLYVIASGAPGFDLGKGFAANGYGAHSPGQYDL